MRITPRAAAAVAVTLAAAALGAGPAHAAPADQPLAPLHLADGGTQPTDGARPYVVLLKDRVGATRASATGRAQVAEHAAAAAERGRGKGAKVRKTLAGLGAYTAVMDTATLEQVRRDPEVLMVTEPTRKRASATWGLDRSDQRYLPLDGGYSPQGDGAGVHAYVIDTGLNYSHTEYAGRTEAGYDAIDGGAATDCAGHGTHVAGTIAGTTYGVAKKATVVPVRVLGCDGYSSGYSIEDGIDWVIANAKLPAVANMSLGGGADAGLDTAVRRLTQAGVLTAVAAGNDNSDACYTSPAREASAITVGATASNDARASFSNYGSCVDLFGPGQSITSSWIGSSTATSTISGTSMATPHVAGALALFAQKNPGATQAQAAQALVDTSTKNVVADPAGSPNRLLFVNAFGGTTPTPTPSPTPTGCTGYQYQWNGTLAVGGDSRQPGESYYQTTRSMTHTACLAGPDGADFDLYLQRWNGSAWVTVASAAGPTASEQLRYYGAAGSYRYWVDAASGSGAFALGASFA